MFICVSNKRITSEFKILFIKKSIWILYDIKKKLFKRERLYTFCSVMLTTFLESAAPSKYPNNLEQNKYTFVLEFDYVRLKVYQRNSKPEKCRTLTAIAMVWLSGHLVLQITQVSSKKGSSFSSALQLEWCYVF